MARIEYPEAVGKLVEELRRLPGVGPRSAERIAIWLLQSSRADPLALASALEEAKAEVVACANCGFFATAERCAICADSSRESVLCVVEQATDVLPLERSGAFKGRYHCLGGKLSPLDNVTPDDLRIGPLMRRIESEGVTEVILAPGSDVEGEATANYLAGLLKGKCPVTRIAQGLPAGGGLEHADALTLARALEGRRGL
ncbi:recombination mediator RecR [Luteolibacter arcticus]|uniref:Recombination protein RecR n=1 Tax=Luteolibacter arcticus TaxID=1581411 RepID=A0ABT3GSW8_9BACT|nr:recombination mediator RecR [Luteolibacter arcticus]MCW1926580.1 recombination mediator RecR [Luteolibacter arcticus]